MTLVAMLNLSDIIMIVNPLAWEKNKKVIKA